MMAEPEIIAAGAEIIQQSLREWAIEHLAEFDKLDADVRARVFAVAAIAVAVSLLSACGRSPVHAKASLALAIAAVVEDEVAEA